MTVKLYLGDCLEIMQELEDGSVDAVITDPPYGVDFKKQVWDECIPDWFEIARRLTGVLCFTTAPTTMWDYPRPDWVSCWYRTAAQSRNAQGGFNHWTPILVYGDVKFKVDTYYTHGMVTHQKVKHIKHPSPKDPDMTKWIIENASSPGDTILDPFMGSGTTGVACVQTGRNFIGIEIEPKYYEIAEARIAEAQLQIRMEI